MRDVDGVGRLEEPRDGPKIRSERLSSSSVLFVKRKLCPTRSQVSLRDAEMIRKTDEIVNVGGITGKVGNESPIRLIHSSRVAIADCVGSTESPLQSDDDDDGENESERSNEHRFRQSRPRNESGRGFAGSIVSGNVPEGSDEGTTGEEEKEGDSEIGRTGCEKIQRNEQPRKMNEK